MLKQYNTINQLFRILTNLKTINISNAFYAIKYFKSNNNYTYMNNNNSQQFMYANNNNNYNKVDTSLSFKKTPPIMNQQRNYNYRTHTKYNSNNIPNERIKRAKSLKSTPIHVNKSFSSSVPLNNYNFNNCSWYNFNQNNNSNSNNGFIGVTPVKKKDTISVKSMLNKREKTLMSKLKKEHNIKFKQSQSTKTNSHKYSNSALNKSYNSNYQMVNKKMNLLDEINLNDDEQEYDMNKERQLIEIDGDDYNYNEYNNYQHSNNNNYNDQQFEQQDVQYYNNSNYNNNNYNNMSNYYPKSTKASHLFNTEIYSLRMSDNY